MQRSSYLAQIDALFRTHPMVGLLGPRAMRQDDSGARLHR